MNDEMKKILSRFLFTSVLICCIGLLASGSITASQRSAKNTFDKAYAVMNIKNTKDTIEINVGKKKYALSFNISDKIKRYEDYILLSPFASVYYFGQTCHRLFESLRYPA